MAKKKKGKKKGGVLSNIILIIALGVFIYAAYNLISAQLEYKKGSDEYDNLRNYTAENKVTPTPIDQKDAVLSHEPFSRACPKTVDWASLKAINPDIIGWIYCEAIPKIDYPIVQGRDNDQYLHHTFEGTANFAGSIFIDYQNAADFTDPNTIIYGHNMKNQSMFGLLKKYREDANLVAENPYIWVLTPNGDYCYQIFSTYATYKESDTYMEFTNPTADPTHEFANWLTKMKGQSEVATEITPTEVDHVITLSTCTSDSETRCVVQAVLRNMQPVAWVTPSPSPTPEMPAEQTEQPAQ